MAFRSSTCTHHRLMSFLPSGFVRFWDSPDVQFGELLIQQRPLSVPLQPMRLLAEEADGADREIAAVGSIFGLGFHRKGQDLAINVSLG